MWFVLFLLGTVGQRNVSSAARRTRTDIQHLPLTRPGPFARSASPHFSLKPTPLQARVSTYVCLVSQAWLWRLPTGRAFPGLWLAERPRSRLEHPRKRISVHCATRDKHRRQGYVSEQGTFFRRDQDNGKGIVIRTDIGTDLDECKRSVVPFVSLRVEALGGA